jgi:hypothetical protein
MPNNIFLENAIKYLISYLQLYPGGRPPESDSFTPEWTPVELEMVTKLWLPDSEILRLKGFHRLSVLDRLQVRRSHGD